MCSDLEASLSLLDVLFGVENDDVNLRHVEHPKRDERTEGHGHSQSGCLDEHLWRQRDKETTSERELSRVPPRQVSRTACLPVTTLSTQRISRLAEVSIWNSLSSTTTF